MFWDFINSKLDSINSNLDNFIKKLDIMNDHMKSGYSEKEYDEDYKKFYAELSNLSDFEIDREKFLLTSFIQTNNKDMDYSGYSLLISSCVLVFTLLFNVLSLINDNIQNYKKEFLLFALIVTLVFLSFLIIAMIFTQIRNIGLNHQKQKCRLKLYIANEIQKERLNSEDDIFS